MLQLKRLLLSYYPGHVVVIQTDRRDELVGKESSTDVMERWKCRDMGGGGVKRATVDSLLQTASQRLSFQHNLILHCFALTERDQTFCRRLHCM